jgi:isoquinoline 1-oxidoreductase beta subunit
MNRRTSGTPNQEVVNLSRRGFLKITGLAGGGLILGVVLPSPGDCRAEATAPASGVGAVFTPNAFVRVAPDGTVTVVANRSEMGQGVYTSLALLVAEEIDAEWSRVRVESAPVDPAYNNPGFGMQVTGGSNSTRSEWTPLRKAGAAARAMLVAAAADHWKVDAATCRTEPGEVLHPTSGRRAPYGTLVEAASRLTPPADPPLKDEKKFRLIGRGAKRLDTPDKTNGKAIYGLDVSVPGMKVALVARPPVLGGKLKSFDAARAKAVPGVREVFAIDRGVAVVADGFWPAKLGREALDVVWDEGPMAAFDSAAQRQEYLDLARKPGAVAFNAGDTARAFGGAAKTLNAIYEVPYLAHATMEPHNCVADVRADGCDVWIGTQFQTIDRVAAVQETGLKPEQVQLHTTLLGGGFGRRGWFDSHFVREAVQISKAIRGPVKLVWTREDDIRGGFYRPRATHAVKAGLDGAGSLVGWEQRVVCQSIFMGTPAAAFTVKEGIDRSAVEGAADLLYAIPSLRVEWHQAPAGIPVMIWRSVGHSHTAFVVESFFDEVAHAAGKDPVDLRRKLLEKQPRALAALDLAVEKAGWGKPLPPGRAQGVAVAETFGSYVAQVAEVSLTNAGRPRVHRVVCAVECGPVVNPDGVRAQMEGGIVFGLTAALYGEITFTKGRVQQRNFHDYPMLRINEAPAVETHIVPSVAPMGGIGEVAVPPIAPAVTNALFALTGKRVRRLPIRTEDLS